MLPWATPLSSRATPLIRAVSSNFISPRLTYKKLSTVVLAQVEIGIAVAVQVGPGGAGAPGGIFPWLQTAFLGHVDKATAFAGILGIDRLVMKKGDPPPSCHQQIGPAVTIDIGDGTAMR